MLSYLTRQVMYFIYLFIICLKYVERPNTEKKLIINISMEKKKHRNKLLFNVKTSYEVFLKDFFVIDWNSN